MQRREFGLAGELLFEAAIGGSIGALISIGCLFAIPTEKLVSVGIQKTIPTMVLGCAVAGIATGRFSRVSGYNEAVRENNERLGYEQAMQQVPTAQTMATPPQTAMAYPLHAPLVPQGSHGAVAGKGSGAMVTSWPSVDSNGHHDSEDLFG